MQQHYINVTKKHKLTEDEFYEKDSLQTVTVAQHNYKLKTITHYTLYKVMENLQTMIAEISYEQDPTASSYFIRLANTHADIVSLYYGNFENEYFSLRTVENILFKHVEFYGEEGFIQHAVKNTALEKYFADENFDYSDYLSN